MRSLALSKKNLLIAISVLVFPVFVYGGTPTIAILNPYTGRLDLINKLSSTSIDELVDVDTGAATAGDCLVYNTYASSSVWEPGSCGTGGGGGTSTYNSTVTISIGAGGDAYQSTNTFAPIPGASFVMSRSTLTTIGLMAYTLYPSTVASTFFKLALTTSPDTGTPWTYISPILEVATSMKYSNYYSTVFVVNDRQAIALHCSRLAATGITPSEYGVKLDGYVQSAFGGIPIIAASGVGGGSLFVEPANVAVSTIVFANGDFIFVSDGVAGGTMTVKNSSGSWSAAQTFISSTTFSSSTINIAGIVWFVQSSASASGDKILHRIGDTNQVFWGGDGGTGGGGGGGSALFIQPDNVSISSMVLYYGDLNFVSDGVSGGTLTVKDSSGAWTAAQTFISSITVISTSTARGGFYVTGKIQAGRSDESSINVPLYVRGYSPTAGAGNGMAIYIINSDNTSFLGLGFTGNVAGNRDILMRTSGSGPRSLHINASNDTSTQGDIILNTDGKVLFLESITTLDSAAVTSNMTVGGAMMVVDSFTVAGASFCIGGTCYVYQATAPLTGFFFFDEASKRVFTVTQTPGSGSGDGGSALFVQPNNVSVSSIVFRNGDFIFVSDGVSGGTMTVKNSSGSWSAAQTFISSTTFSSSTLNIGGVVNFFQSTVPAEGDLILHRISGSSFTYWGGDGGSGSDGDSGVSTYDSTVTVTIGSGGDVYIATNTFAPIPAATFTMSRSTLQTIGLSAYVIYPSTNASVFFKLALSTAQGSDAPWTYISPIIEVATGTKYSNYYSTAFTVYDHQSIALHCVATFPYAGFIPSEFGMKIDGYVQSAFGGIPFVGGSGVGGGSLFVQPNNVTVSSIVFKNGDFIFVSDGASGGTMTVKNSSGSWSAAQTFISSTTFSSSTINIAGNVWFVQSTASASGDQILHRIGNTNQVFWGGDGGSGSSAGGIQASLAVGTGSFVAMNVVLSPTFALNFDSGAFRTSLVTGATAFVTIGTNAIDGLSTIPYSAVLRYSSATGMAMWDTPHPREFYWGGASLLAVSTSNSPNVAPVVKTTATYGDVMGASYDDTLEECRGGSFIVPEYADTFSTPTFSAYWFPSNKGGVTGNVVWDVKYGSGVTDSNSWNMPASTATAAVSAGYAGFARQSYISWQPAGVGGSRGHGSMASMGWQPLSEVNFWVCREGGNASDTLVGDAVLKSFLIRVGMR